MTKKKNVQDIKTNVPSQEPWEGRETLKRKDDLLHLQKSVAQHFLDATKGSSKVVKNIFAGFLEIADFMFKNTCGVGSNFKLAECAITEISRENIFQYYKVLVVLLGYHFGCLVPKHQQAVWEAVLSTTQDRDFCESFSKTLAECIDHENAGFSPVQAGHKFWQQTCDLLCVQDQAINPTGRIYYQTAPGQNLIYIVEQGVEEGWLKTA